MQSAACTQARQHFLPPSSPSSFPKLNQMGFSISLSLCNAPTLLPALPLPLQAVCQQDNRLQGFCQTNKNSYRAAPSHGHWMENPLDPVVWKSWSAVLGCLDPWSTKICRQRAELLLPGRKAEGRGRDQRQSHNSYLLKIKQPSSFGEEHLQGAGPLQDG